MTVSDDPPPVVACTVTPGQLADRSGELSTLKAAYLGAEEREGGYMLRFDGADEVFRAIAAFVAHERQCCSFAGYRLETTPPYEESRLTITGPEGTKDLFGEGLLKLLGPG